MNVKIFIRGSIAFLLASSLFIHQQVLGDEASDKAERESLIVAIQRDLRNMSEKLDRVASASSSNEVEDAIEFADSLGDDIDRLERVQGDDSAARGIVDRYPDFLEDFQDAAQSLLKLKKSQIDQEQRRLWKTCEEEDKNLRDQVTRLYMEPLNSISGLAEIPALAKSVGSKIHENFKHDIEQERDVTDAFNLARRFSVSESGGWSDVSSNLREASEDIWRKYETQLKDIKEKCAAIDKMEGNPFIVESLRILAEVNSTAKQLLENILRDWGAWKEIRREMSVKYTFNLEKVRTAICENDDEKIFAEVVAASATAQNELKSKYELMSKELEQLIDRLNKLEEKHGASAGADARKWRGTMRTAKGKLDKVLLESDTLQGVQNVKLTARIQVGQDEHKKLQSSCTKAEHTIPDGRIDCVNIGSNRCEVIEIKPNNDKAKSAGRRQLERYKSSIDEMHKKESLSNPSDMFKPFISCINTNGSLDIDYRIETYDFCPASLEEIDDMADEERAEINASDN